VSCLGDRSRGAGMYFPEGSGGSRITWGPVDAPVECATTADNQSGGLYRHSGGPGTLLVRVSWDKRSATTFTSVHSGRAQFFGRAASPHYEKVVVAGLPAYWQLRPTPGPSGSWPKQHEKWARGHAHFDGPQPIPSGECPSSHPQPPLTGMAASHSTRRRRYPHASDRHPWSVRRNR
jgi:hypothetical protein